MLVGEVELLGELDHCDTSQEEDASSCNHMEDRLVLTDQGGLVTVGGVQAFDQILGGLGDAFDDFGRKLGGREKAHDSLRGDCREVAG